jgi:hypothetical protein
VDKWFGGFTARYLLMETEVTETKGDIQSKE